MASKKVTVIYGANAQEFNRVTEGVMRKVGQFSGLGQAVKANLTQALGGFTLGAIFEHIGDFAKSLEDASKRLGITIQETYKLKEAAREAGMEFETWFGVRRKTEAFLQGLANGTATNANVAKRLGLTSNMRWIDAVRQALQATEGMGQGDARKLLEKVVGPKQVDVILGNRDAILKNRPSIDAQAVHTMARFRLELEMLTDEITVGVLPALSKFIEWLTDAVGYKSNAEEKAKQAGEMAAAYNFNRREKGLVAPDEPGFFKRLNAESDFESKITGIVTGSPAEKKKFYEDAVRAYLTDLYGPEAAEAGLKEYTENFGEPQTPSERREQRRKQFEEEQKKLLENVDRKPTAPQLSKEFATNQFLKIGGLMGTDIGYRMERLQIQANSYLARIADGVDAMSGEEMEGPEEGSINMGNAGN